MKEKNISILAFFYLGGDVLLGLIGNIGILSYAFRFVPKNLDLMLLGFSVLGIYLVDRTYDSWKETEKERTPRGTFYIRKTRFTMVTGLALLIFSLTFACLVYETKFLAGGLLLGMLVGIYLWMHYFLTAPFFPKELLIAFLYCSGAAYPIYYFRPPHSLAEFSIYLLFFLSIFCEILSLSLVDFAWDKKHHQTSLPIAIGKKKTKSVFYTFLGLGLFLAFLTYSFFQELELVAVGYCLYFFCLGLLSFFLSRIPAHLSKMILELSYFPFVLYFYL
jgi:hypothetical protein